VLPFSSLGFAPFLREEEKEEEVSDALVNPNPKSGLNKFKEVGSTNSSMATPSTPS
jgi:hypothetical protein